MKVVHVQSVIQTVFGVVDDEGNVVNKQPVSIEVARLSEADFHEALAKLGNVKEELSKKLIN